MFHRRPLNRVGHGHMLPEEVNRAVWQSIVFRYGPSGKGTVRGWWSVSLLGSSQHEEMKASCFGFVRVTREGATAIRTTDLLIRAQCPNIWII